MEAIVAVSATPSTRTDRELVFEYLRVEGELLNQIGAFAESLGNASIENPGSAWNPGLASFTQPGRPLRPATCGRVWQSPLVGAQTKPRLLERRGDQRVVAPGGKIPERVSRVPD